MLPPAAMFFIVGYVGCNKVAAVSIVTISGTFLGSTLAGACINKLDIAPNYAGLSNVTTLNARSPFY